MAGVSGLGLAIATGGALLVYAGLKDVSPLDALRDIASGRPSGVPSHSAGYSPSGDASSDTFTWQKASKVPQGAAFSPLVAAVWQFRADTYSQAKRWQPGYSDCSSWVGKGFKSLGITPPGGSTTWDYLSWDQLHKVTTGGAGDLVISTSHMAVLTGPGTAIGQQSPKSNVRTGPIKDVMYGAGSYAIYRYVGPTSGGAGGVARSGTVNA
jgi:hypothetical protein